MDSEIWLACDDPWYRDCLIEVLRPTRRTVLIAERVSEPPEGVGLLLANHDAHTFDLFRWSPLLTEAGAMFPVVALFDVADRDRAAAAARSLPFFACLIKPTPNEIVALSVRRALESRPEVPEPAPAPIPHDDRDLRRDVLQVFV